jgi:hypothetical protein
VEAEQPHAGIACSEEEEHELADLALKFVIFVARHHPCKWSVTELMVMWITFGTRAPDLGRHSAE